MTKNDYELDYNLYNISLLCQGLYYSPNKLFFIKRAVIYIVIKSSPLNFTITSIQVHLIKRSVILIFLNDWWCKSGYGTFNKILWNLYLQQEFYQRSCQLYFTKGAVIWIVLKEQSFEFLQVYSNLPSLKSHFFGFSSISCHVNDLKGYSWRF